MADAARTHLALLDSAAMGPRQYAIWLLASGGTLLDGFSIFSLGVAMALVTVQFKLSPLMIGLIGSALVLGAAFGAAFGGSAADRFGRKPLLLLDMAILAVGAFISALSDAHLFMLAGQFLVGIGIGIDFPVSASYVSETMPKKARSRMMVATISLQSVGMLVGAAVALTTLRFWGSGDWRPIVGATGVGAMSVPNGTALAYGKPALADAAWPRTGSGASRLQACRHRGAAAASAAREGRAGRPLASDVEALSHAHVAGFGAVVSDGYRYLWRWPVHPGDPWCHPYFFSTGGPLSVEYANAQGCAAIDLFLLFGFLIGLWAVPRFGRIHMQVAGFAA